MRESGTESTYEGVWWLPGPADKRIGGILELERTFELRTLDLLNEGGSRQLRGRDDIVINGLTQKQSISLFGCRLSRSKTNLGGYSTTTFRVGWALRGSFPIEDEADAVFDRVRVSISNLSAFANRPTSETLEFQGRTASVRHSTPPNLEARLPGARLSLISALNWSDGARTSYLEGLERVELDLETPLSFRDIERRYIRPLRYLVGLASGEFCDVEIFQVAQGFHEDERIRHLWFDVEPYQGRWESIVPREVESADMLFTLVDREFESLIADWFALVDECGSSIDLMFALDGPGNIFVGNRYFNAVSALEGLHQQLYPDEPAEVRANQKRIDAVLKNVLEKDDRAWIRTHLAGAYRPFLRERLKTLILLAGSTLPEVVGNTELWIKKVKGLRDLIGHGASEVDVDLAVQVRLTSSLELLYRTILLRRIGFSDDDCRNRLLASRSWSYLAVAIQADIPDLHLKH